MSEENNQVEETEAAEMEEEGSAPRRSFFTRRNFGIGFGLAAILLVVLALFVTVSYRYGVFDNYIKAQFVAKLAEIGIVFDADTFRVTINPLKLELKNATFNDKVSGEKLFFIRDASLGLTIQNLYAWQLSRDITLDSTEIAGAEVWVKFDENGKSNFSNLTIVEDEAGSSVNFKYDSIKVSVRDSIVHFGDVSRKIAADAKNVALFLEPTNPATPDELKRYQFDLSSTESNFVYDERVLAPIDLKIKGIGDDKGAEFSEFTLKTPIGESALNGTLTDWANPKYNFKISSTVDLTQTSNIFPLGTSLRGVGNFNGTVSGEGETYKVDGEITSEALSAANVYLKALNVAATVNGTNSMYEVNGKAIAELLTFDDFRIEFPQIIGNVRGSGTDFKWLGELQAVALKSPDLSLGRLFISDAVAEYKEQTGEFTATAGNGRAGSFIIGGDTEFQNLQARNLSLRNQGDVTNISSPNVTSGSFKTEDFNLKGVTGRNVRITDRPQDTKISADTLTAQNADTEDARLKNLTANDFNLTTQGKNVDITAKNLRADGLESNGANIAGLNADGLTLRNTPGETVIYSNNLKVAKLTTDAAVLGSLNIAGVRLTVRQGTISGTSGDINAGNIALTKSEDLPQGGTLENVKIFKPVFTVEPSGRYRATADMSLGGGVLGSVTLGAARANVAVNNDQVALNNLSADVMEGNLSGDATIALNNRNRSNVNVNFNNLDLGKLLALQGGQIVPVEGQTTGSVNLAFTGTNFKTASGAINADITANAGNAERGLIPLTGKVEATATNGLFNITTARLNTEKTEFTATGSFDLNSENSDLNLALNSTDAGEIERIVKVLNLSPELEQQTADLSLQFAGNLNLNGNFKGNINNPTFEGRASLESILLNGRDVGSIGLGISATPDLISLRDARFQERNGGSVAFDLDYPRNGTNNIAIRATIDKINTGTILALAPVNLPAELQNIQAQTSGTINLTGLPNEMQGEANISSGAGTINGQPFDGFDSRVLFAGTLVTIEKFETKFGDGFLRANGTYETETTVFDLNVEGRNIDLARVRPFIPNSQNLPNITGVVNLTAKATGEALETATYNINFNGAGQGVTVNDRGIGAVTFAGVTENQQLNANLTVNFEGQPQKLTATVNFANPNLPFRAETTFKDSQLAPFIALVRTPEEGATEVSGTATGTVFLEGNLSSEDALGIRTFSTDNLSGSAEFSQLALQIGETPIEAVEPVSVRFNTREVVIKSARFAGGGSNLVVSGTKALTADGINNLAIDGNVNLSIFNALSKDAFFAGIADVAVRLTGVNETARLNGTAELKNSSIAAFVGSERLTLERVNGRILFTSNQAQIEQLSGFLGGGRITASGGALIEGLELQQFRFDLRGTDITAPIPPDFVTTGDANIQLTGFRENGEINSLIAGTIRAKRSVYTKEIDLADVLSGRSRDSLSESSGDGGSSFLGIPKLDIQIEGRDALTVRNNVADLTASVSLRFTGDVDFPQIAGRISASSGTVFFRNDRYEVQRGELVFPPNTSIEPFINLQAESEIQGYQVIVSLVGELSNTENLVANVRSNPALPQADVISLITTGTLTNTDGGIPTLAQSGLNTAAEIITDSLINDPARKATDRLFGLNVFEIDPIINGQRLNASARLTVGRRINRNLQVTYSTNLSQNQEQVLALEYRVSNRLSLVAQYEQRSLSNVTQQNSAFSFEVRLRKRF